MNIVKPTFLGIGGMKCGTTWLSECLRYHPEVFISSPKEIHFFSTQKYWDKGPDWYFNHFKDAGNAKAIGEFSPSYIRSTQTSPDEMMKRIIDLIGNVKIIVTVRNPVDRYISHMKHIIRDGTIPGLLNIDLETFHQLNEQHPNLLFFGQLSDVIKKFQISFSFEKVLILEMENFKINPHDEIKKVYRFLDVSQDYSPKILRKQISVGIVPRFERLDKARLFIARYLYRKNPGIVDFVKRYRLPDLYRKLNSRKKVNLLSPTTMKYLNDYYNNEILEISKLLSEQKSMWKF